MKPYYEQDGVRILNGDCRTVLASMDAGSVNCCVTSPPYFGLRDYGTARWEGGATDCDHIERTAADCHASSTLGPKRDGLRPENAAFRALERQFRGICGKCGALRHDAQIGLEPTPDAYVAEMVGVFREVRRVLRDDGTVWLNLGDSYGGPKGNTAMTGGKSDPARGEAMYGGVTVAFGKPKDLIGIPWRVAFALQADGWYLRQDIIWHKPNPMPESVTDRCTKAHEYVFLLSKSERYYYDAEAIKEPGVSSGSSALDAEDRNADLRHIEGADLGKESHASGTRTGVNLSRAYRGVDWATEGRNRRSVWTIATQPYSGAHFATMPPDLVKPCVLAGCPDGGVVLDPFSGSGTTAFVARDNGRRAVGIELNETYCALAAKRLAQGVLAFP